MRRAIPLALLLSIVLIGLSISPSGADPDLAVFRVGLTADQPILDNTVTRVEWDSVDQISGQPFAVLDGGVIEFTRGCLCVVEIHMDWPVASQTGFRRMSARLDTGGFSNRIAAVQLGDNSGDGYGHSSSGPIEIEAGDRIYVEVKQRSGSGTVLQDTNLTWLVIWEPG